MALAVIMIFTGDGSVALAADTASASASGLAAGMGYLAAALVTGLSCIGGGIAVANAASSALRSHGRRYRSVRSDHLLHDPW